ncbi:hypothetical protein [Pseudogracilibacillus sp. SO30301A]|uniref:hypothetical protein n=1 Tax=Pseudogracilibacillus sp. SO30301A TaxID=3098291 RepID=UPI00300E39FC
MKKIGFMLLMVLLIIVSAACSNTDDMNENTTGDKTEPSEAQQENDDQAEDEADDNGETLTLQLLKADEENGETIEGHNIYSELDQIVKDNPDMGVANDFSVFVVNAIYDDEENAKLLLLAINRLPDPIKNLSFNYTLGTEDGEYVFENQHVTMDEETAGVLQPNSTFPLVLSITPEQDEVLKKIDENNQVVKIEDFEFETE